MKVIDLLNKIANGEEDIPKHILFEGIDYFFEDNEYRDFYAEVCYVDLSKEVRIIEEPKKIEKMPLHFLSCDCNENEKLLLGKLNQIIDYINKGE